MTVLLHETAILHPHPHPDLLVVLTVLAGFLLAGWTLYRSMSQG